VHGSWFHSDRRLYSPLTFGANRSGTDGDSTFLAPLIEVVCGVPVVTKYILLIIGTASSYGQAFRKRRCLIPADGFYEWRKVLGGKIPYNIQMKDGRPFAFAGLWEGWKPPGILEPIVADVQASRPDAR
jgi:hypothetical protein